MSKGLVQIYYGEGRGKTTAAYGSALRAVGEGKTVYIIQFLKAKDTAENEIFKRLEPEIKLFRFEKFSDCYDHLTEEEKKEESMNMKNGIAYARKVLVTGECDFLILDEVLGLVDNGVITAEDLESVVQAKGEFTDIVFTGRVLEEAIRPYADEIYNIVAEKTCIEDTL